MRWDLKHEERVVPLRDADRLSYTYANGDASPSHGHAHIFRTMTHQHQNKKVCSPTPKDTGTAIVTSSVNLGATRDC
jgi:hypothetical protein